MKQNTLAAFANSHNQSDNNVWKILNAVAASAGDDHTAGKQAVHDMIVSLTLRHAMECKDDDTVNTGREIRSRLSRLNEMYPFDVVAANTDVNRLFAAYNDLVSGFGCYTTMALLQNTLNDVSHRNDDGLPPATQAQLDAWDYL